MPPDPPTVSRIPAAGATLAVVEQGEGPSVLLVHGMAATAADWAPVTAALATEARVVAYDRRGYGASEAPQTYERTTVNEQAEDLVAVLAALGLAPAVLCGADLGALAVLDVLIRHPRLARAAVLVGPPLYAFVPAATEALSWERVVLEEKLREGGPRAAVAAYLGGASRARVARAQQYAGAFFADYGGVSSWPVARRDLRAIDVPVAVLDPERPSSHGRAAADALAALLPAGERRPGADPVPALLELLQAVGTF